MQVWLRQSSRSLSVTALTTLVADFYVYHSVLLCSMKSSNRDGIFSTHRKSPTAADFRSEVWKKSPYLRHYAGCPASAVVVLDVAGM